MRYSKPTLKIEKFEIEENITEEILSSNVTTPDPDDSNIDDIAHEIIKNVFNLG